MGYGTDGLTFRTLRDANLKRLPLFKDAKGRTCHSEKDGSDWQPAQWLQAVVGELGELDDGSAEVDAQRPEWYGPLTSGNARFAPRNDDVMGEWMSKGPADGQGAMTAYTLRAERHSQQTAHLIVNGRPACANLTRLDGTTPALAPFKCSWVTLHPYDKKCGYCRRIERSAVAETSRGVPRCDRCPKCGSDLAAAPGNHQEPIPHTWVTKYDQNTGAPYEACTTCRRSRSDLEAEEASAKAG
jgi:hypothetical protein